MPADEPAVPAPAAAPQRSLLRRYLVSFAAVVGLPLAGYTVVGVWTAAAEHRSALVEVQRTNAEAAAFRIAQFVRDGSQADEVNDSPDNIWYEVKFDKPHEVLVDATVDPPSLDLEPYASDGRAQHPRLRRATPGRPRA